MALPPEPLFALLPASVWIVDAEVEQVLSEGSLPPPPARAAPSGGLKLRPQTVRLKVRRVLRGPHALDTLTVEKPEGSYLLRPGNHGPFLLDANDPPHILGRYGPDTHPVGRIQAALSGSQP